MTLKEQIASGIEHHSQLMETCVKLMRLVDFLGIQDEFGYPNEYMGGSLKIEAKDPEEAGRIMRILLPKVGNFTKDFNEYDGKLSLTTEHDGIIIRIVYGGGQSCRVREVTEEVMIPARKELRTKFVKEGNCDPVLENPTESFNKILENL